MDPKLEGWKIFIRGRIAQEENRHPEAVVNFDEALALYPDNPSFIRSRDYSVRVIQQNGGLVARIEEQYRNLATTYSGANDKPQQWISGLSGLADEISKLEKYAL